MKNLRISLLTLGDELLNGLRANAHVLHVGAKLLEIGLDLDACLNLGDRKDLIINAVKSMITENEILIVSGGLGPTIDDVTRESLAKALGRKITRDLPTLRMLKKRWTERYADKGSWPKCNEKQADYLTGAEIIPNANGAAIGQKIVLENCVIFVLPGPPAEFNPMFDEFVMPYIESQIKKRYYTTQILLHGVPESKVSERLKELLSEYSDVEVADCATAQGVALLLRSLREYSIFSAEKIIKRAYADAVIESGDLVTEALELLRKHGKKLVLAESCTGGMISSKMVDIPGCSDVYLGSLCVYDNALKTRALSVEADLIRTYGAVSGETASAMAMNAQSMLNDKDTIALSVTGLAGPKGATERKPLGLVYVAIADDTHTEVQQFRFYGDRNTIRDRAAYQALFELCSYLKRQD